jgi:hypothetical protein
MGQARRCRLELSEVQRVLPGMRNRRAHCAEVGDQPILYRVYVPGRMSDDLTLIRTLREEVYDVLSHPDWRKGVKARRYRIAILAQTHTRLRSLKELVAKSDFANLAEFVFEFAPGPEELKESIDAISL